MKLVMGRETRKQDSNNSMQKSVFKWKNAKLYFPLKKFKYKQWHQGLGLI